MRDADEILLTVAEAAGRLGVTPKALRLYERRGLVSPRRTEAGWRMYGRAELERLHEILALKALGLSLERIGELLSGSAPDLERVLSAQEQALSREASRVDRALSMVRAARKALSAGDGLSTDELIDLTREISMSELKPNPALEGLIKKHYSPEQLAELKARDWTDADQAEANKRWGALIARAEALLGGDPGSPEALALAREWRAEAAKFHQHDPKLKASLNKVYAEGFAQSAQAMPFSPEVFAFMNAAQKKLDEEDGPVV
ncbi:MAG: MerR family transcriptional regulator [Maricaulaceae bacterium]|jgi:DNA-binding transcriptional MerR regulator